MTVDDVEVDRRRRRRAARRPARAVRHAEGRRAGRRRSATTSRSTWPRPSTARRSRAAPRPTSPTRSAASSCSRAWTRRWSGSSPATRATFTTPLVGGDYAGRDAEVTVTVRTVKEKELPALDDDFAQLASEFDTLDELRERPARPGSARSRRSSRSTRPATRCSSTLVEAADVPVPEGVVKAEVEDREQAMTDQLERIGADPGTTTSTAEGKTEEEFDAELTEAADRGRQDPAPPRRDRRRRGDRRSPTTSSATRSCTRRSAPRCARSSTTTSSCGPARPAAVFADVRRNKALASVLEQRHDHRHRRATRLNLDDLRGPRRRGPRPRDDAPRRARPRGH